MKWFAVIFIAIIIEGITEYLKTAVPKLAAKTWVLLLVTSIFGIGVAVAFGVDLFEIVGIPAKVPYIGQVLTGVLVGRGSNYIYDLIGKYTESKETAKALDNDYIKPLVENETHEVEDDE